MQTPKLTLSVLPSRFAICRISPDSEVPSWSSSTEFCSITRSRDELSVVCLSKNVPPNTQAERDWRALKVQGPLELSLTGVLASLAQPLAEAKISVFAISTYDTDYLLVREDSLSEAIRALKDEGHSVEQ